MPATPRLVFIDSFADLNARPKPMLAIVENVDMTVTENVDIRMPRNGRYMLKALTFVCRQWTSYVGVQQVTTATAVGTCTANGVLKAVVTASGVTGSPRSNTFAVAAGDTPAMWAAKAAAAIAADANVTAVYAVSNVGATIILTALTAAANDATLNIALSHPVSTGITAAPTSANTTAGVLAVKQVATTAVTGQITGTNPSQAKVIFTASGVTGSPITLYFPVTVNEYWLTIAPRIVALLNANAAITGSYAITTDGAGNIVVTALAAAANDGTLNLRVTNDTCTGLTQTDSSATTAGAAGTAQVETATAAGAVTQTGDMTVTVTGAGIGGSPITISVPVVNSDAAATWGPKVVTALQAIPAITSRYTVSGSTTSIVLTDKQKAANDATLNIALANGATIGTTDAPTSVATTAGVAAGGQSGATCAAYNYDGSSNVETVSNSNALTGSDSVNKTQALALVTGIQVIPGANFLRVTKSSGSTATVSVGDLVAEFVALP